MFSAGHNGTGRAGIALLYGSFSACRALEASIHKDFVALKAHLPLREDGIMEAFVSPPMSAEDALCILKDWLVYLQAPDTTGWRLTRDTAIIFPLRR